MDLDIFHVSTAQRHGIYPKPWNREFRHSRYGALGVCNECHGEQKKSNENVLRQIDHHTSLLKSIKIGQMRFLGRAIRKEKLEHLSLTGLIPGKRARGRQRQTYMQQFGKSQITLIHDAYDRKVWKGYS